MSVLPALLVALATLNPVAPAEAPRAMLVQQAGSAAPADLFRQAAEHWTSGDREQAVFWFYAGQLRFRSYLAANPGGDPSGAPALFASLMEGVGRPINEYAFGDIPELQRTIDAVLAWDHSQSRPDIACGIA